MSAHEKIQRGFMVSVRQVHDDERTYRVAYLPRGLSQEKEAGGKPKRVSEFVALVHLLPKKPSVEWEAPPPEVDKSLADFSEDARKRATLLRKWLRTLGQLVGPVRTWVEELGWATKAIEKAMEDSDIGRYKCTALLMQEDTVKILLEPVARSAPGAEGLADLYLLPGYDDIASIYYYDKQWNIHYLAPGDPNVAKVREAQALPLNKANLRLVLDEMKSNA